MNYPYQNGNNYEPQPQQRGEGKRAQKEFPLNSGSYTGTVLPITGKMEDEIRISPLKSKDGVVVHFTLLIEEPAGVDQYGPKMKRIYRRVTAFSNNKIPESLLRSLRPGDRIKISASDIDESYDKRDGTKGYREAKQAYYIERVSSPSMQPGGYQYPGGQPAAQQGGFYPQGAPVPQYTPQPQFGGGYPAPQQGGFYPQGAPQYGPGGYPAPQQSGYIPGQHAPAQQPAAPGYQRPAPGWSPGAAEQRNRQAGVQAPQGNIPYYQAPGPAVPPPNDEDMPADIAAGVKELDV